MLFKRWFRGRERSRVEPDSVWLSDAACLVGLAGKATSLSADGRVLVLAHFPRTLDAVEEATRPRTGSML